MCECRINLCIEFITGQKFLVLFLLTGFYISKVSKQRLVFGYFWSLVILDNFHKTTNEIWTENSKMTWLKDCKSCRGNDLLSLAKGKPYEENEQKFSNQSGDVMYASIYLTNRRKSFFFSVTLWYDFII